MNKFGRTDLQKTRLMAKLSQEQLQEIFNALKKEMKPYEKGHIKACADTAGKYDLWSQKPGIVILGKPRPALGFVTIALQSTYVGFYYMPIYCNYEAMSGKLSPDLLKLLKGKACFHIKTTDKELMKQVGVAMKVGYEGYKKNGWA